MAALDQEAAQATARHPLDFIVLGVGRSGTTALAGALNLDPGIFCGIEYFHEMPRADFATMRMPDAFFDEAYRATTPNNTRTSREILRAKLEAGTVRAYGNKHPNYTLVLDRLNADMPGLRNLCIYRKAESVASSWDRRAENAHDPHWPSGRIGLYGIVSWLILLSRLVETGHDVRFIDYQALFFEDAAHAEPLYAFVGGAPVAPAVMDRFRAEMFSGGKPRPGRRGGGEASPYAALLEAIGVADLDAAMTGHGFVALDPVRETLRGFVAGAWAPTERFLADWVEANARPDVLDYGWKWACHSINAYDTLESPTLAASIPVFAEFMRRMAKADPAMAAAFAGRVRAAVGRLPPAARPALEALARELPKRAAGVPPPIRSHGSTYQAAQHDMAARAHLREGRPEEALAEARLADEAAPEELRYRSLLIDALLRTGGTAEAEALLAEALARHPEDAVLLRMQARLLSMTGRVELAEAAARRALELTPRDKPTQELHARILRQLTHRQRLAERGATRRAETPAG